MKQMGYNLASCLLALCAFCGTADAQTFRTVNRLEANGYALLKSSASVTGELSVSTTSPSGYVLKLSSATGAAGQGLLYVTNTGLVGIGQASPPYRLTVSSGPGEAGTIMAVSTGATTLFWVAGDGAHALKFFGDGSGLTNLTGAADNLGNHTATKNLDMATFNLINVGSITANAAITTYSSMTVAGNAFSVGGSTFVVKSGRVGIGSTNPDDGWGAWGAKLDITGGGLGVGGLRRLVGDANTTYIFSGSEGGDISFNTQAGNGTILFKPGSSSLVVSGNVSASTVIASGDITASRYQISGSTVLAVLQGSGSFGVGIDAGRINGGDYNSFVGYQAGYANTSGGSNSFIGSMAGYSNTTGQTGSFFGNGAGVLNTTGWHNTYGGYQSGRNNQTGSANAIFGSEAGYGVNNNSFSSSTLMGFRAGYGLTTGSDNILFGWQAGYAVTSGTGNIVIGYSKDVSAPAASNELNIGGALYGKLDAKTIGVGRTAPNIQAALDVVSTGTAADQMAQIWRNGSGTIVSSMSATGVMMAARFVGDGSGLTGVGGGAEISVSTINAAATTPYGGVNITTNVFVNGNLGVGLKTPTAALQVQSYVAGSYSMYVSTSATAGQYSIAVASTGITNINGLVLENRTVDPETPVPGQIWLRVD